MSTRWPMRMAGRSSTRGLDAKPCRAAWEAALAGPLAGRPVARVLVTHHHPDHVGLAGWFQSQGAELLMTRTAWLFARMLTLDVQETATPEQIAFWSSAGMAPEILEARRTERPFNFADVVAPMPLGFTRIEEGAAPEAGRARLDRAFRARPRARSRDALVRRR